MSFQSFDFSDFLIAFDDKRHAVSHPRQSAREEQAADDLTLTIVSFDDDSSVHADRWEIHRSGDEVLCVVEGRLQVAFDDPDGAAEVVIAAGQAIIVPRQTWHRLQALAPGRLVVLTPRASTELRPYLAKPPTLPPRSR